VVLSNRSAKRVGGAVSQSTDAWPEVVGRDHLAIRLGDSNR
jgi:hypothetical protein